MNRPPAPTACAPSTGRSRARVLVGALATSALMGAGAGAALVMSAGACSLGNVQRADCSSDKQCDSLFGEGSRCDQGYCTAGAATNCTVTGKDGRPCFQCKPKAPVEFANVCSSAACQPFDAKRLTKLTADGGLPSLP